MNPQQLLCFNVRLTWVVGFNIEMKYEVLIQDIVNDVDGQLYFVLLRFKNRGWHHCWQICPPTLTERIQESWLLWRCAVCVHENILSCKNIKQMLVCIRIFNLEEYSQSQCQSTSVKGIQDVLFGVLYSAYSCCSSVSRFATHVHISSSFSQFIWLCRYFH